MDTFKALASAVNNVDLRRDILGNSAWTPFYVALADATPVGFLRPDVRDALAEEARSAPETWEYREGSSAGFAFHSQLTAAARTANINALAQKWKEAGLFSDALDGWRGEQYAVYGPSLEPSGGNMAFTLERSACCLFGLTTFGVHCTAYVRAGGELKLWVPRRAATKQTWPLFLDNSVAGGITAGDKPRESMLRECVEEASLSPDVVDPSLVSTGPISYTYLTKEGYLQPELQYIYDLELQADISLAVNDGEVDSFELMSIKEVVDAMVAGKFKPNCVLVIIDFLMRHGLYTPEDDPEYVTVASLLHAPPVLPVPR